MYYMLHIGKTGGSYAKHVFASMPDTRELVRVLPHSFTLDKAVNVFGGQPVIFSVRDPFDIFVSGFYSRLRRGRPTYNIPWTPGEAAAFTRFRSPNALAEALSADNDEMKESARAAMKSIWHVNRCLRYYLRSVAALRRHKSRVPFILRQDSLDADIELFLAKNGIGPHAFNRNDAVKHSNPADLDKTLSDGARENLAAWYRIDLNLYAECRLMAATTNRA